MRSRMVIKIEVQTGLKAPRVMVPCRARPGGLAELLVISLVELQFPALLLRALVRVAMVVQVRSVLLLRMLQPVRRARVEWPLRPPRLHRRSSQERHPPRQLQFLWIPSNQPQSRQNVPDGRVFCNSPGRTFRRVRLVTHVTQQLQQQPMRRFEPSSNEMIAILLFLRTLS